MHLSPLQAAIKRQHLVWKMKAWVAAHRLAILCASAATWCVLTVTVASHASDYETALTAFRTGNYRDAEAIAQVEVDRGIWSSRWSQLLIECQMAVGDLKPALETYQQAIKRYRTSLRLRYLGIDVLRHNGMSDAADEDEAEFFRQLQRAMSGYISREDLVVAGVYLAERGEDARKILQLFFDRVRERDPEYLDVYIATAELALSKGDYAVAGQTLDEAAAQNVRDARIPFLRSLALRSTDADASSAALQRALAINPNHGPSLRAVAANAIDAERYDLAESVLSDALQVNIHDADAWALLSVVSHLRGHFGSEQLRRAAALSTWNENPQVDFRIGQTLSKKYRFAEAAAAQRRALEFKPSDTPAVFALSQDLMRLGETDLGWQLAQQAADDDPYNVVAFNLLTLLDRVGEFPTLTRDGITVRMEPTEAKVYGQEVLDLLCEAKAVLGDKYKTPLPDQIIVEIFDRQDDFAIRTFGLPGGAGFLGVCFGNVITANSPASQGARPANWKSVLWHEFCHTVTLTKTKNRMPRWLSEGISVYEERQRSKRWGEVMTPRYRQMILGRDLTPLSDLSSAFMQPRTPSHLMFAYFESSLAVEFIIDQHGFDALIAILDDLGQGIPIADAMARQLGSPTKADMAFAKFAKDQAQAFGPALSWPSTSGTEASREMPQPEDIEALKGFVRFNPTSYQGLSSLAKALVEAERFDEAVSPLETLQRLGGTTGRRDDWLEQLAFVHAQRGDERAERVTLLDIIDLSPDPLPALRRLIALDSKAENWSDVFQWANLTFDIAPMATDIQASIAEAAQHIGKHQRRVDALTALNAMEPLDPLAIQYQLADAYHRSGQHAQAKTQVLHVLEVAPRYRDAHALLLELVERTDP